MPYCAVKWCVNHSGKHKKKDGITFHIFPTNPKRKAIWAEAVRKERRDPTWLPNKSSRICSLHFNEDDLYASNKGYKNLKKSAIPICTMIRPDQPAGEISGPSFTTKKINVQNESSVLLKDVKGEANLGEPTNTRRLHVPDCSCTAENINKLVEKCSHQTNEVNEQVCSNTEEVIIKVEFEESGCSYVEETNHKVIECPSCKYEFCIPIEKLEKQASLPASEETKPSCSNPLSVPLSQVESVFETLEIQKLEKKLELKTALARNRLLKLKNLQRRNKRLINKNLRLKHVIENLKKEGRKLGKSN